jgi:hypothetical protein
MISVKWSPVKCASSYEVLQKENVEGSEWKVMESVRVPELSIKGVACTQYSYGVRVTVRGEQSSVVEAAAPVEIPLDRILPYHPSAHLTVLTQTGLELTWDHSVCISSYRVRVCRDVTQVCSDSNV